MSNHYNSLKKVNQSIFRRTLFIGWIGGIVFGILYYFLSYFKLIDKYMVASLKLKYGFFSLVTHWYGKVFLLLIISVLSILIAIVYYVIAKKISKWYVGAIFGVVLWLIIYALFSMFLNQNYIINKQTVHQSINSLCLFVLYGLFVGYSISFAYKMETEQLLSEQNKY